jgi:ribonucleoside-triphosphate reductase
LPQEVVDEHTYNEYVMQLSEVDLEAANSFDELMEDGCATGACPIK